MNSSPITPEIGKEERSLTDDELIRQYVYNRCKQEGFRDLNDFQKNNSTKNLAHLIIGACQNFHAEKISNENAQFKQSLQPEGKTLEEEIQDNAETYAFSGVDSNHVAELNLIQGYIAGAKEYANHPRNEWVPILTEFAQSCYVGCSKSQLDELRIKAEKLLDLHKSNR